MGNLLTLYRNKKCNNIQKEKDYPALPFYECPAKTTASGKPGISVLQHALNTAAIAQKLSEIYHIPILQTIGLILAALHDTGKISPGFIKKYFYEFIEKKIPSLSEIPIEVFCTLHAEISEAAIRDFFDFSFDSDSAAKIVGIHHGKRKEPVKHSAEIYGGQSWAKERLKFIKEIFQRYGNIVNKNNQSNIKNISEFEESILAGFVSVSDWLASDPQNFPDDSFDENKVNEYASRALHKCGFRKLLIRKNLSFRDIFGFNPNDSQRQFFESANKPGIYILEETTGAGKTEAALYTAYRMLAKGINRGIYFALPTKLTSDSIHQRVQEFVDKICIEHCPVMLSHGSAWLKEELIELIKSGGEEFAPGRSWFMPSKRTLLAPLGVGTVDQALMAVMNVKHFFIRTFGLAGKVVILDEVHSYDFYTGTILESLVKALYKMNCTVIILSATLTSERKKALIPSVSKNTYPLISIYDREGINKEIEICNSGKQKKVKIEFDCSENINETFSNIIKRALKGECILWISNTVARAQYIYKSLKSSLTENSIKVGTLHSRFPVSRRQNIEEEWINILGKNSNKRPKGAILVATQVVEQSVDIDADFMVTELAPIDMIIQRMGRLWRHQRKNRPTNEPEILITTGNIENAETKDEFIEAIGKNNAYVYAPYVLWKTFQILRNYRYIVVPTDIRLLLEGVYAPLRGEEPEFVKILYKEMEKERERMKNLAGGVFHGLAIPEMSDDDQNVATRYSDIPTVECLLVEDIIVSQTRIEIILPHGISIQINPEEREVRKLKQLHMFTVSIAKYNICKPDSNLSCPSFLKKYFYGELAILKIGDNGNLIYNDTPTALFYTDEIGVYRDVGLNVDHNKIIDYNNFNTGEWDYESCVW